MILEFRWDPTKADKNMRKHGVTFEEASTIFEDVLSITKRDEEHSTYQNRFITIGLARTGKLIVVVHADQKANIRIISARKATRNERLDYEEG